MADDVNEDWPIGLIVAVPRAWRGESLWDDIRVQTQDRIGADLRAMYADLLRQPLSPGLERLVHQIKTRLETLPHEC
ncbi:hypothetical protein FS320_41175 [Microvirga tunisiensis]|uniref:Anti-sigma factor NepR domain-containing protein n=1 Tax=Microvirga tunisiensis TaxID=2108360 RepID=A0A5N7MW61_9HYPH|nr:hypothetical protein [Microvirga tunisiensis]MPR31148.1 hypothetical protein [Microvirga tunisiensis]